MPTIYVNDLTMYDETHGQSAPLLAPLSQQR